jgi:hypothetical protein
VLAGTEVSTFSSVDRRAPLGATQPQRPEPHDPAMADPDVDDALLTAAERAREAQEHLAQTPPEDPAIVPKAHKVYQRAEEVDELAEDAADDRASED